MAENVRPGYGGETCYELDIFEANNNAMQTALHTSLGGAYGSGNCDRNGCFARIGGPQSPGHLQGAYGRWGKEIDSSKPFGVKVAADALGALTITLHQDGKTVTSFDRNMAGNPQGAGVHSSALNAIKGAQGKLALVASLWQSPDLSWLDGPGCNQCSLSSASYTIRIKDGSVPDVGPPVLGGGGGGATPTGLNPSFGVAMPTAPGLDPTFGTVEEPGDDKEVPPEFLVESQPSEGATSFVVAG